MYIYFIFFLGGGGGVQGIIIAIRPESPGNADNDTNIVKIPKNLSTKCQHLNILPHPSKRKYIDIFVFSSI